MSFGTGTAKSWQRFFNIRQKSFVYGTTLRNLNSANKRLFSLGSSRTQHTQHCTTTTHPISKTALRTIDHMSKLLLASLYSATTLNNSATQHRNFRRYFSKKNTIYTHRLPVTHCNDIPTHSHCSGSFFLRLGGGVDDAEVDGPDEHHAVRNSRHPPKKKKERN